MSRTSYKAQKAAVFVLLCSAVGVALFLRFRTPRGMESAPEKPRAENESAAPELSRKKEIRVSQRRDAAFWPQQPHPLHMLYRTLTPSTEFPAQADVKPEQSAVWLLQCGGPLDHSDIEALLEKGIAVLMPTAANAFHVRASHQALKSAAATFEPRLLGWCRLSPDDRLMPAVHNDAAPSYALDSGGRIKRRLELYPKSDVRSVADAVVALGGRVLRVDLPLSARVPHATRSMEVSGPAGVDFSAQLAGLDAVYAVDYPRPVKKVSNEEAAAASAIPPLVNSPRNLSGMGVTILVRDQAAIFNHPDYGPRLTLGPDVVSETPAQHSTHVAGTIGGDGLADTSALAKGMAPNCTIISFDMAGDDVDEPLQAKNSFSAMISNHSYGFITGWDAGTFTDNQDTFGQYSTFARNWDALVRSESLIMIKAAGNDRNDSGSGFPHDGMLAADGEYYYTTDASSTSKNVLIVGAVMDGVLAGAASTSNVVLPGSSSGPSKDGRLRPEIVANGDSVNSTNNSTTPGNEYVRLTGTSMASAVVAGATVLFMEAYKQRFTSSASAAPHYLRALYAQTATDFGNPGPDYLHGFGLLNAASAMSLFDTDSGSGKRLHSGSLDATTGERFYVLSSDGVTAIKATLCWTDDAGDILSANALVNDLDVRLIRASDQTESLPWVLNAAAPEKPATNGVNSVDTIEQVYLQAPPAGNYLLAVRASSLATPTGFTLASSHDLVENLPPTAQFSSSSTSGPSPFPVSFDASASSDPDGSIAQYVWDFGDGTTGSGVQVQHTYADGSFKAVLKVVDDKGASAKRTVVIAVNNKLPVATISVSPNSGPAPFSPMFTSFGSYDPDGQITSFLWDFGDGGTSALPQVQHTYSAPGLYTVSLTVTDTGNGTATRSITVMSGTSLAPTTSRFSLNFKKIGLDSFSLSSKSAAVKPDLGTSGLSGSVRVGLTDFSFILDNKGRYKSPQLNVSLTPAKQTLTITLRHIDLVQALAKTGATSRDVRGGVVGIPFAFTLNDGTLLGSPSLQFSYTATQGKSGSGKFLKP